MTTSPCNYRIFLISVGNSAVVFELAEQAFDGVPFFIMAIIAVNVSFPV